MALIRKSLYKDLVSVRNDLFNEKQETTKKLEEVSTKLSEEEKFVENFDASQDALNKSIANLEALIATSKEEIKKIDENIDILKSKYEKAREEATEAAENLKAEEEKLKILQAEEAPESEIKAQEAKVQEATAVLSSKESAAESIRSEVDKNKVLADSKHKIIEESEKSITENNQQLADNEERKANSEEKIKDLTDSKEGTTNDLNSISATYDEFLSENQDTINTFEDQQLRRDANIPKHSANEAFSRTPADASVVVQADEVMVEVVKDELKPENETEEDQLKSYIEKGREPDINPSYLNAEDARILTLASVWSTKEVALAIRNACLRGEFEVVVSSLPNNIIYALSEAGYVMHMTEVDEDKNSEIIISWANYKTKES